MRSGRSIWLTTVATAAWVACVAPSEAQEMRVVEPTPEMDGVVLFANGLWRHTDAAGPRCTDIAHVGEFCALPSIWAPFPGQPDDHRTHFFQADRFRGFAASLTPIATDRPIGQDDVIRYIARRVTGRGGNMMAQHQNLVSTAAGRTWITTPFTGGRTVLISMTEVNGRVVFAETQEFGTTLVNQQHNIAHQAFLDGLTLAEQW